MGKYMRKGKVSDEVAVMEVAAAPLGVRTRARALALQRLPQGDGGVAGKDGGGGEYLELRSRRLEKLPPRAVRRKVAAAAAAATAEQVDFEVSLGKSVLGSEAMERSARETTPCSLIRDSEAISTPGSLLRNSETISTPGSTTRPSHCRVQTPVCSIIPHSSELDEFFIAAEQLEQQAFVDKYNFDPVNDCPLPGWYEWVKLD